MRSLISKALLLSLVLTTGVALRAAEKQKYDLSCARGLVLLGNAARLEKISAPVLKERPEITILKFMGTSDATIVREGGKPQDRLVARYGCVITGNISKEPRANLFGLIENVAPASPGGPSTILFNHYTQEIIKPDRDLWIIGSPEDIQAAVSALPDTTLYRVSEHTDLNVALQHATGLDSFISQVTKNNVALLYFFPKSTLEAKLLGYRSPDAHPWAEQFKKVQALGLNMYSGGSVESLADFMSESAEHGKTLLIWGHSNNGHDMLYLAGEPGSASLERKQLCGCNVTEHVQKVFKRTGKRIGVILKNCDVASKPGLAWTLVGKDVPTIAPRERYTQSGIEDLVEISSWTGGNESQSLLEKRAALLRRGTAILSIWFAMQGLDDDDDERRSTTAQ